MTDRHKSDFRFNLMALPQCSVLVVENDEPVQTRLASLLKSSTYKVFTASSAEEALAFLEGHTCNIVVTDWEMPGMDGIELCRQLRLRDAEQYIYTIILTRRTGEHNIHTALGAGADDYLSKEASGKELLARIEVGRRIARLEHSLRTSNEEIRQLSETDPLTGTRNRRYLLEYLPRELERSRRYLHPISILSFDLDNFKHINDCCGHEVGDQILRTLAERMTSCLRQSMDWIARSGGDEFVIVLPETGLNGARCVAEKIRQTIVTPAIATTAGKIDLTVSIGATALETAHELLETSVIELLRAADKCLHASKSLGRDRTTCVSVAVATLTDARVSAQVRYEIN